MLLKPTNMGGECCECLSWSPDICQEGCAWPTTYGFDDWVFNPSLCSCCDCPNPEAMSCIQRLVRTHLSQYISDSCDKWLFVRGLPSWKWKKGPAARPQIVMYDNAAATGHIGDSIHPRNISMLFTNWSHLETFKWILSIFGFSTLSTLMSFHARCICGWNVEHMSTVISPARRNPKKEIEHAAYSMTVFLSTFPAIVLNMPKRVSANRGRWGFFGEVCPILCLPTPFNMSFSRGQNDNDLGSSSSASI